MKPDYIGSAIKHAQTELDALKLLGSYDKKTNSIIDKHRNKLTILEIKEV